MLPITYNTGEIGFQLGAGYNINQNLSIELGYQAINAKMTADTMGLSFGFGSIEIAEAITLNTKYTF